jgi:Flp pilus assembly protein TadG
LRLRRFSKDDGAQSLVEFALVLPLLLLMITGLFDVARAAWQENTLAYAAREGTRYAIVHGSGSTTLPLGPSDPSEAHIANVVTSNAVGVYGITVTTAWPDGSNDRGMRVSVDASAPFVPLPSQYLLGGAFLITLKGGSMLVIQQ